jgi:hypothetical protein
MSVYSTLMTYASKEAIEWLVKDWLLFDARCMIQLGVDGFQA